MANTIKTSYLEVGDKIRVVLINPEDIRPTFAKAFNLRDSVEVVVRQVQRKPGVRPGTPYYIQVETEQAITAYGWFTGFTTHLLPKEE